MCTHELKIISLSEDFDSGLDFICDWEFVSFDDKRSKVRQNGQTRVPKSSVVDGNHRLALELTLDRAGRIQALKGYGETYLEKQAKIKSAEVQI